MIVVNREDFIAWTQGYLLDRRADGSVRIGDKEIHEKAEKAMDEGSTIALSDRGEIISYMKVIDGEYREFIAE